MDDAPPRRRATAGVSSLGPWHRRARSCPSWSRRSATRPRDGRPRKVKRGNPGQGRSASARDRARRTTALSWQPGSEVLTDRACAAGGRLLDGVVGSHRVDPHRLRAAGTMPAMAPFKWVNTTPSGNIKQRDHRNLAASSAPRSCPTLPRQLRLGDTTGATSDATP